MRARLLTARHESASLALRAGVYAVGAREIVADYGLHKVSLKVHYVIGSDKHAFEVPPLRAYTIPPSLPLLLSFNLSPPKNAAMTLETDSITPTGTHDTAGRWRLMEKP